MATMPAARPSSPSIRLIAWVMPSSHSTVTSGIQSSASTITVDERDAEVVHRRRRTSTSTMPASDDAGDLRRRRDVADVVDEADGEDDDRRETARPSGSELRANRSSKRSISRATAAPTRNPTNIATPPNRGVGLVCTGASSGRYDPARRLAPARPTSGVSDERETARDAPPTDADSRRPDMVGRTGRPALRALDAG